MKTKQNELFTNQNKIIELIKNNFKINKIYLFGSYVRGDFNEDSDIDLYITLNEDILSFEEYTKLTYAIKKILINANLYSRMDLLLNSQKDFDNRKVTNGNIEYIVNKEGIIIYESDKALFQI